MRNSLDIENYLKSLGKQYDDARHICYAWVLGDAGEQIKAHDDGEPGHSAGDPILGQIRSKELTNTLVAVVRYFGGTKLGVSGLINAYKTAASLALEQTKVIKIYPVDTVELEYAYEATNAIQKLISDFNISILKENFGVKCLLSGEVRTGKTNSLLKSLESMKQMGEDIHLKRVTYYEREK